MRKVPANLTSVRVLIPRANTELPQNAYQRRLSFPLGMTTSKRNLFLYYPPQLHYSSSVAMKFATVLKKIWYGRHRHCKLSQFGGRESILIDQKQTQRVSITKKKPLAIRASLLFICPVVWPSWYCAFARQVAIFLNVVKKCKFWDMESCTASCRR